MSELKFPLSLFFIFYFADLVGRICRGGKYLLFSVIDAGNLLPLPHNTKITGKR